MLERSQLQQLYQYGLSLTHHTQDAHDLLQTALEKWVKSGKPARTPAAYIRKIMRNQFIDDCRRRKIVSFEPLEESEPLMLDEQSLEQQTINSDMIEQLLEHLNVTEREVLYLWAVLEYTTSEIATELEIPRGTILSRLFRIRKKAQQFMITADDPERIAMEINA